MRYSTQSLSVFIPFQVNEWQSDWVAFYSQQRLQHQLNMVEKEYGDREARELWAMLQVHLPFDQSKTKKFNIFQLCQQFEDLNDASLIYSWRSLSFSQMWRLFLLSSMETYGEATWLSVLTAPSSLTPLLTMAIQSLSWLSLGCLVASTALFILLTMKRFLKHQDLQREVSFTNFSIT